MELFERKLQEKPIFSGRIIQVHVDTVELPNGHTSTREVVNHPGGVGILALDQERITAAGYEDHEGVYCVYAVTDDGGGYETRYWIGTETGLLAACERYWEGERIYRMTTLELSVGQADEAMFLLPDGENPF